MLELSSTKVTPLTDPSGEAASMRILLASPRGFCAGVTRAIEAVRDAIAKHGAPVYVRRPIVHNMEVVRSLECQGAVFVQELDEVPPGGVVVFSAHGVAPSIADDARARNLTAYDAVCPLVGKVHREVERHQRTGRVVILIGHDGHPEIEGTLGHAASGRSFVVASTKDVSQLPITNDTPAAYAIQTTYSVDEANEIVKALRNKFSDLAGPPSSDICYATTNRQKAVHAIAGIADTMFIVGEEFSSNAQRLAEVARLHCCNVQLLARPDEIDWSRLPKNGVLGLSAAASTPEASVQAVIDALCGAYAVTLEEFTTGRETAVFKRLEIS